MNRLFLHNLLLALPIKGFFWATALLLFCFFGIHLLQLAKWGWDASQKPVSPPSKQEKEPSAKPAQEPVYYIVEHKTRRAKPSYGEPKLTKIKQIKFKP